MFCRVKRRFQSKITIFFHAPLKEFPLQVGIGAWGQKTRMMGYSTEIIIIIIIINVCALSLRCALFYFPQLHTLLASEVEYFYVARALVAFIAAGKQM